MDATFNGPALPFTLDREGRVFTDNPADPGGATMWGVTLARYRLFVGDPAFPVSALRALTEAGLTAFYAAAEWQANRCDDLMLGVDFFVFDASVNTASNAARQLQTVCGMAGADVDGWIGSETIAALAKLDAQGVVTKLGKPSIVAIQTAARLDKVDGVAGPHTLAAVVAHPALAIVGGLAEAAEAFYRTRKGFPVFGTGWLNRVTVRRNAAMALAVAGRSVPWTRLRS